MSEAVLCEPRKTEVRVVMSGSFETVEEARAAIQQTFCFEPERTRRSGYVTVSRYPRKAEAVGAILLKIIMSVTGWVPESELVYSDYPEKQRKMAAALRDLVRTGAVRCGGRTPRGYSYTLGNKWKLTELTEENNDRQADQ